METRRGAGGHLRALQGSRTYLQIITPLRRGELKWRRRKGSIKKGGQASDQEITTPRKEHADWRGRNNNLSPKEIGESYFKKGRPLTVDQNE